MSDDEAPLPDGKRALDWDPERVTVHEALCREEGARAVFERFGLDTCCGGELPVAAAAAHHDVDVDRLLDAIVLAGEESEP